MSCSVPWIILFLISLRPLLRQVAATELSSFDTVPAFIWSSNFPLASGDKVVRDVNYQTISLKDLTKSLMYQGGWFHSLCHSKESREKLDIALIFVGRELLSSEISEINVAHSSILQLLKDSFTSSNFSMAFPYVSPLQTTIKNDLLSEVAGSCDLDSRLANVVVTESCASEADTFEKVSNLDGLKDYLVSRFEQRISGPAQVVVFCQGNPGKALDHHQDEKESLLQLTKFMDVLKAKYSVLYISDPSFSDNAYQKPIRKSLAENVTANLTLNPIFCNEVCQIKSSLLEGFLVGAILLIILLSGLCCMMGIDTPVRFETSQE